MIDILNKTVQEMIDMEKEIMGQSIPAIDKDKMTFYYNPNNQLHKNSWKKYYQLNFDINYIGLAEKVYRSQYALISPNGDYFSTTFGGHTTKALSIISANKILLEEFVQYLIDNKEIQPNEKDRALEDIYYYGHSLSGMNTALDFLMETKKWTKISYGTNGQIVTVVFDEIRGMTKEQERTYCVSRMFFKNKE